MSALPPVSPLGDIKDRLSRIFPETFPDRAPLVGEMAARAVFVALYGGFLEGSERFFRPSTVIRFSLRQAALVSETERLAWLSVSQSPGYRPSDQWYADNTREPLRDDLIRNRAIPVGIVKKREGFAPTSPAPIYCLSRSFAALFDPELDGDALDTAIANWQEEHLDVLTLKRMRLLAMGVEGRAGQVELRLPTTGKTLRLAAGDASVITRDACTELLPRIMKKPVVVHVSISDQKTFPELAGEADAVGLKLSTSAELPDIVAVDVAARGMALAFIEVVHSDGPITELRKQALLRIAQDAGVPPGNVRMLTAFEDREAPAFKKRVSELARDTAVWFRSEPDLLLDLRVMV